jgi:hypothetical protein
LGSHNQFQRFLKLTDGVRIAQISLNRRRFEPLNHTHGRFKDDALFLNTSLQFSFGLSHVARSI